MGIGRKKHSIFYIEFDTIHGFRHPQGSLGTNISPTDKGGQLYKQRQTCICGYKFLPPKNKNINISGHARPFQHLLPKRVSHQNWAITLRPILHSPAPSTCEHSKFPKASWKYIYSKIQNYPQEGWALSLQSQDPSLPNWSLDTQKLSQSSFSLLQSKHFFPQSRSVTSRLKMSGKYHPLVNYGSIIETSHKLQAHYVPSHPLFDPGPVWKGQEPTAQSVVSNDHVSSRPFTIRGPRVTTPWSCQ